MLSAQNPYSPCEPQSLPVLKTHHQLDFCPPEQKRPSPPHHGLRSCGASLSPRGRRHFLTEQQEEVCGPLPAGGQLVLGGREHRAVVLAATEGRPSRGSQAGEGGPCLLSSARLPAACVEQDSGNREQNAGEPSAPLVARLPPGPQPHVLLLSGSAQTGQASRSC